ncbi:FAD-binding protein, partial [Sutterella massiliensis]
SFLMPKDETPESKNAFIEDVKAKSMGGGRVDLYEVLAERILPAIKWAESKGAQFEPWQQQAPWRVGVRIASPGQYRGMPKLLETLHDAFEKAGGKERFEVKAKALLLNEKGAVCGCRVLTAAGFEDIHAGAVVLATGGYSANRAMLESCHPGGGSILIRGNKWITGDG